MLGVSQFQFQHLTQGQLHQVRNASSFDWEPRSNVLAESDKGLRLHNRTAQLGSFASLFNRRLCHHTPDDMRT